MKKRSLLLVLTFVLVFVLVLATACVDEHDHTWGDWQLTTEPTETATGVAKRVCECGESEIKNDVPALSDAATWTKSETPATHTEDGSAVYTSVYGTVTITLPKGEGAHTYTWTIATNPTLEAVGSATGVCSCGDSTTVELAVLSDASVWTKDSASYPATCANDGKDIYTSVYGTVEVVLAADGQHTWGNWTLTTAPTMETVGVATHQCSVCNASETKDDVAVLSDSSVWTKVDDECVAASCTTEGKDVYTSVYGKVEVAVAKTAHTSVYAHNADGHWQVCSVCEEVLGEVAAHEYVDGKCVCGKLSTNFATTSFAQLAALVPNSNNTTTERYFVIGTVAEITDNYNAQIIINNESGEQFVVYGIFNEDGTVRNQAPSETFAIGDVAVFYGVVTNHNGTIEAKNAWTVQIKGEEKINLAGIYLTGVSAPEIAKEDFDLQSGNHTWTVKSGSGIVIDGNHATVTRTAEDQVVVITATATVEGATASKDFTVTIPAKSDNETIVITSSGLGISSQSGYSVSGDAVIDGVSFNHLGMGGYAWLQWRSNNKTTGTSILWNSTAIPGSIIKVEFVWESSKDLPSNTEQLKVELGTDDTFAASSQLISLTEGKFVLELAADQNITFIRITHNNKGAVYLAAINITYVPVEVHQHEWSEWSIVKVATCAEEGLKERVCECGEKQTETIEKVAHTVVVDAAKAATCTATGLTEGSHCSVCNETIVAQTVVEKLDHSWGDWTILAQATCFRTGSQVRECSVCHEQESEVIEKLPHTWGAETVVSATCVADGYTSHRCTVCGTSEKYDIVPALGHAWTITSEPTLEESGEAKCTRCGRTETVAVLTDASVWTATVIQEKTYNVPEITQFTSVYGQLEAITAAKLVAPYDCKTYSSANIKIDDNGKISKWAGWSNSLLEVDEFGIGYGQGYPFRGKYVFEVVDVATGEIKITVYNIVSSSSGNNDDDDDDYGWDSDGETYSLRAASNEIVYATEPSAVYTAWLDWETGVFVMPVYGVWSEVNVAIPVPADTVVDYTNDILSTDNFSACTFAGQMAITYTKEDFTESIFVGLRRAYLGVTFQADQEVETSALVSCNLITILDANGEEIVIYAKDLNGVFVVADGLQGEYAGEFGTLKVSGSGIATLDNVSGTYVVSNDILGVYVGGSYYEISLDGSAYIGEKPMVTITFDNDGVTPDESFESTNVVNKNIAITLPVLTTETKQLKGWFADAEHTIRVDSNYIPTSDVTLYALWTDKVVITLQNLNDGSNNVLYLCEGDVIGDYLPKYTLADFSKGTLTLNQAGNKYFAGWFMDEDFEFAVSEEAEVGVDNTGLIIYAKWVDLGTYTVTATDKYTFVYDKNNEWWASNNKGISSSSANIYFKASTTPVVIEITYWIESEKSYDYLQAQKSSYSGTIFGTLFSTKGSNYTQAQAVTVTYILTDGAELKLCYSKDGSGNTGSDTAWLILKINGEVFCGVKDGLQGTYACADADNIVVDGLADLTIGNSERIAYEIVSNEDGVAVLGIYTDNNTSYKEIVIDLANGTYTISVPTVEISLVTEYGEASNIQSNKNTSIELPALTADGYVFRGWYTDEAYTTAVSLSGGKYVATADVTLYAKWDAAVIVSYNYLNGDANTDVSKFFNDTLGTVLEIGEATNGSKSFVGWFTKDGTADGDWGEAVTSSLVLSEDLVVDGVINIYAQWVNAYSMMGTYVGWNFCGTSSGTKSSLSDALTITATGLATKSGSYGPLGLQIAEEYKDVTDGVIYFGEKWYAYYNDEYGLLWYRYSADANGVGTDTMFVVRKDIFVSLDFSGKSINGKYTGWVTLTCANEGENTVVNIFLYDNRIYTNVTWSNGLTAKECKDKDHEIFAADGSVIAVKVGDKLSVPDATRGIYTNVADESETVFLNGVGGIVVGGTTYTITVIDADNNIYGATTESGYAEYTFDFENDTYSVAQPQVEISFVTAHSEASNIQANKNASIELPVLTADGYVFRGWYTDEAYTTAVSLSGGKYIVTADVILYAKWDAAVTVVWNYLVEGVENSVVTDKYYNDKVITVLSTSEITNDGKVFVAWFTQNGSENGEWGTEISSSTVLSEEYAVNGKIVFYAKWVVPAASTGVYKGFNHDVNNENGTLTVSSQSMVVTIDALGSYSNNRGDKGTLTDLEMTVSVGAIKLGSRYTYVNVVAGMVWFGYSTSASTVGHDTYIGFDVSKIKSVEYSGIKGTAVGAESYVAWYSLTLVDDSTMNVFCYNDVIYDNVTWTSGISAKNASASDVTVYDKNGEVIAIKRGNSIVTFDGYEGITYSGKLSGVDTTAVLDGAGIITIDGETYNYAIADAGSNKISVTMDNKVVYLVLDKAAATFTQATDGLEGTYTLPDGGSITLDGFGFAGDGKTYVVSGSNITIYDGENSTTYGLDVANKVFLGKSAFAGLTYRHGTDGTQTITFEDSSEIKGRMVVGYVSWYADFTGVLEGDTLTLTVTSAVGCGANAGNTIVFNVVDGQLIIVSEPFGSYIDVETGWTYNVVQ